MSMIGTALTGAVENESKMINKVMNAKEKLEKFSADPKLPVLRMVAGVHLKSGAVPKFLKARTVPFHYRKLVEDALDQLVSENMLEPVSF